MDVIYLLAAAALLIGALGLVSGCCALEKRQ